MAHEEQEAAWSVVVAQLPCELQFQLGPACLLRAPLSLAPGRLRAQLQLSLCWPPLPVSSSGGAGQQPPPREVFSFRAAALGRRRRRVC